MRLSVIIPTLNEAEHVARAIGSAYRCGAVEVIVVDGGSSDNTPCLAERQAARVMEGPRGRSRQQNAGAAAATGDHLLFLHADNWLDDACDRQMHKAVRETGFVAAAFYQHITAEGRLYRLLEWGNAARVRWFRAAYGDQGLLVQRDAFERVGGFPDVPLLEDLLLMRKLNRLGRPVLLPGPLHVSPRRWQTHGVVRQTLRNWTLLSAWRLGVSPNALARWYRPQDKL